MRSLNSTGNRLIRNRPNDSVFRYFHETGKLEERCSIPVVELGRLHAAYCQQCGTDDTAYHICSQIIPSRVTTGQIHLMPLIKHAGQQRTGNRNRQLRPSMQSTCQTYAPSQQGKNASMKQFIPWRRYQIYCNRLWSQHEQAEDNTQRQQQCYDAEVTRCQGLQKQNER